VVLIGVISAAGTSRAVMPDWELSSVPGSSLACLLEIPEQRIGLVACAENCVPIPWQMEEHDGAGELIFDAGDLAGHDDSAGVLDGNDSIVFMIADAGRAARSDELNPASCRLALRVRRDGVEDRWVYALAYPSAAPRSPRSYVHYDVEADTLSGDGIVLGFRDRIPQFLSVPEGDHTSANLLDRLKVRASARFLGLIPVSRDESDLEAPEIGWRAGPVRIVRRQRQRIRVGWGIKSPRFIIDTYFSRQSATMPVAFHLNFPPTYFFSNISVETVLDFRGLPGWQVDAPSLDGPKEIDALSPQDLRLLNQTPAEWFALVGPRVQLVQVLEVSASLTPLDRRLVMRVTATGLPPESVVGEMPGIGYGLRGWGAVDRGVHAFAAVTYMLPRDAALTTFLRSRATPAQIEVFPFQSEPP
jgi:hypothetical protein